MFNREQIELTDEQYETIRNWAETHSCIIRNYPTPCNEGKISITFIPTSAKTRICVRCNCGNTIRFNIN